MSWYSNYLSIYNKDSSTIPEEVITKIRTKLANKQSNTPLASVVLIAHNESKCILSCLWSLSENQCNFPIEILAVNNNSTDNTEEILKKVGITYFNEIKKGPGYARQFGLEHAKGKYHICIDSDTIYPPNYIETHVKALMQPNVMCAFGFWSFIPDENHSKFSLWIYESLRDIYLRIQAIKRPELCVRGMVFSFQTEYAKKIGFRTDIIRGEDGSLALEMKSYGKLKLLTTRKARPITGYGTVGADGSLFNSFKIRFIKGVKEASGLFTKKEKYKDEDSNLIKNKK